MVVKSCVAVKRFICVLLIICSVIVLTGCYGVSIDSAVKKYLENSYGYSFSTISSIYSNNVPQEYSKSHSGHYIRVTCTCEKYREPFYVELLESNGSGDLKYNHHLYNVYDGFYNVVVQNSFATVIENQLPKGTMVKAKLSYKSHHLTREDLNQGVRHCLGYDSNMCVYVISSYNEVTKEYLSFLEDLISSCDIEDCSVYLCYTNNSDYESLEDMYYSHMEDFVKRLGYEDSVVRIDLIQITREDGVVSRSVIKNLKEDGD